MESWSELLRTVLDTPGVRYACLTDPADGTVVAARSGPTPADSDTAAATAAALLEWGAAQDGDGPLFEDAVVTTGVAYHLVRSLPGVDAPLVAYLQVDRARGNLALARRALRELAEISRREHENMPPPGGASTTIADGDAGTAPGDHGPAAGAPPGPILPAPRRETTRIPDDQRGGPAGTPPSALAPGSPVPAPTADDEPTGVAAGPPDRPGSRWARDIRTMARLLAGLRRMDRSHTTES